MAERSEKEIDDLARKVLPTPDKDPLLAKAFGERMRKLAQDRAAEGTVVAEPSRQDVQEAFVEARKNLLRRKYDIMTDMALAAEQEVRAQREKERSPANDPALAAATEAMMRATSDKMVREFNVAGQEPIKLDALPEPTKEQRTAQAEEVYQGLKRMAGKADADATKTLKAIADIAAAPNTLNDQILDVVFQQQVSPAPKAGERVVSPETKKQLDAAVQEMADAFRVGKDKLQVPPVTMQGAVPSREERAVQFMQGVIEQRLPEENGKPVATENTRRVQAALKAAEEMRAKGAGSSLPKMDLEVAPPPGTAKPGQEQGKESPVR